MWQRDGVARLLARQLFRCGTSVAANLQEADAGYSRAEFILLNNIARRESRETLLWLRLVSDCQLMPPHRVAGDIVEADELTAILTTIVKNARRRPPER